MLRNGIRRLAVIALYLAAELIQCTLFAQSGETQSTPDGATKVSVFFGTTKALDVGEIRTNALTALKAKGHAVQPTASCVINIAVTGPKSGCAVMFWDLKTKWKYQVEFNNQGQVSEVWAGPMRHGTVGRNDPLPEIPEGGVKTKQ